MEIIKKYRLSLEVFEKESTSKEEKNHCMIDILFRLAVQLKF
jgi:hypothetical protein